MRKNPKKQNTCRLITTLSSYEKRSEIYNMRGYDFTETHILCNKYHMILNSEACFSLNTVEDKNRIH